MPSRTALSARTNKSSVAVRIFVGLFAVFSTGFGAFGFYFATVRPMASIVAARSWIPTPSTILSSAVKTHPGGQHGPTYSVEISFSFVFNGKPHRSDRYSFLTVSSNARGWRDAVVKAYPPGRVTTCYVNPRDPSQAVINRDFQAELLWGLLPLLFFVIGIAVLGGAGWWFLVGRHKEQASALNRQEALSFNETAFCPELRGSAEEQGPITLMPAMSRRAELIGAGILTLLWNGLVTFFVYQKLPVLRGARFDWFDAISLVFLVLFVGAGLFLLARLGIKVLALFNPLPILTLRQARVPLGGTVKLAWYFEGRWDTIESLSIRLKGSEQARKTQRNSQSQNRVFHDQLLVERSQPDEFADGEIDLAIPGNSMHSFESKHNSIAWQLSLVGRIPWWPAVRADFPIRVAPHE
jgi:hypothetical protein